ncbi:hypothetical protein ABPG74_004536 [Tetrahymena malaccensis]
MQPPQPIAIIIRSNQTSQFQETTGLLYLTKQGDNTYYTAIVEKENINTAPFQVLDNNKSPLQLIIEQQEKTRKKAEMIADKIIEEIILQKQKQQMQQNLIKEQSEEIQKLTDDLTQNQESRSMIGFPRMPSTSSLDFNLKRSNSHNQIYNTNQYVQKKNELILQIDKQIERNIKEEQNNIHSYDNISQSSRLSPRGGSPKLNEIRQLNKSRNQFSPEKKISLNKVMSTQEERVETDVSNTSNNARVFPFLNLQQANGNQFDLKEYMKQAILQGKLSNKSASQYPNHDNAENTPAFNLNKQAKTHSQFVSTLSHIEDQGGDSNKHMHNKQREDISNLTNSQRQSINQGEQQVYYNNLDSFSVNNPQSDNISVVSNTLPVNQKISSTQSQGKSQTRLSLAKRNVERDKFKMAHAEVENKTSQFKKINEQQAQNKNKSSTLEINIQDLASKKEEKIKQSSKKSEQDLGQNSASQINDFITKINLMLQKSANINAQIEQSMIDSEKNLKQLESLNSFTTSKQ